MDDSRAIGVNPVMEWQKVVPIRTETKTRHAEKNWFLGIVGAFPYALLVGFAYWAIAYLIVPLILYFRAVGW